MNKIQSALYRFMSGRYGTDKFNMFLIITALVLMVINLLFVRSNVLSTIIWLLLIYNLFRTYSRNIYKRRAENDKYLEAIKPIQRQINIFKKNYQDKEHKYFLCPSCKQMVRVPRKRGKITITCPKCSHKFDKKS